MSNGVECILCGREESEHHEFTEPPPGCKCEGDGWRFCDSVPFVCKAFVEAGYDPGRCSKCEHDAACHSALREGAPSAVVAGQGPDADLNPVGGKP